MKQSKANLARRAPYSKRFVARLFAECEALGITGEEIAAEASKRSQRGSVKPSTVSNVKAHRRKSAAVIQAAIFLRDDRRVAVPA